MIIFDRPRVLSLYTQRQSGTFFIQRLRSDAQIWNDFCLVGADYLVLRKENFGSAAGFLGKYRNNLQEVYANADFTLYAIKTAH